MMDNEWIVGAIHILIEKKILVSALKNRQDIHLINAIKAVNS